LKKCPDIVPGLELFHDEYTGGTFACKAILVAIEENSIHKAGFEEFDGTKDSPLVILQ